MEQTLSASVPFERLSGELPYRVAIALAALLLFLTAL
jgi:hypothetical protein